MAVERVGTAVTSQILLAQMRKAQVELNNTNKQVTSGKLSDTYTGYGTKVATLEAVRSAAARAEANIDTAKQVSSRLDLQNSHLSEFERVAEEVRQTLTNAIATDDGTSMMRRMEELFVQAATILNTKDGSSYTYAGENDQTPPITVSSLADLAALPTVDDAFANGSVARSARIGENRMVQVGVLASDVATELFSLFRDVAQFNASVNGPFGQNLTTAQETFIQSNIPTATTALANATSITAANGDRYRMVQNALNELDSTATVYKSFTSDIEDVDMAEAIARLQQNQLALQASFQISSTLGRLTLLDYLNQ